MSGVGSLRMLARPERERVASWFHQRCDLALDNARIAVRLGPVLVCADLPGWARPALAERYEPFLVQQAGEPTFRVRALPRPDLDLTCFPSIRVFSEAGGRVHHAVRWDFAARIDLGAGTLDLLLGPDAAPLAVDAALRIAASMAAIAAGGLLVHGAAVVSPGGAALFAGVSGRGKSTLARLSEAQPDRRVLTDEMTLVVPEGERRYRAWGTPFWGELQRSRAESAPLRAAFVLEHAPAHAVDALPPAEAVRELLRVVLCFAQDPATCARLLEVASALVSSVSLRRLRFAPRPDVWEAIDAAL